MRTRRIFSKVVLIKQIANTLYIAIANHLLMLTCNLSTSLARLFRTPQGGTLFGPLFRSKSGPMERTVLLVSLGPVWQVWVNPGADVDHSWLSRGAIWDESQSGTSQDNSRKEQAASQPLSQAG